MHCGSTQTVGLFRVTHEGIALRLQCQAAQEEHWLRPLASLVVTHIITAIHEEEML